MTTHEEHRNFETIDLDDFSPYRLGWEELDYAHIEARITTARELRSLAAGEFIATRAQSMAHFFHRVASALADAASSAFGKRSHS